MSTPVGYLQNGKPDCEPGTQCYEDNNDHWKSEIKGWIKVLERYPKRLKGNALKDVQETIKELQKYVDCFD